MIALIRPITLNFTEPIVFLLNLYIALVRILPDRLRRDPSRRNDSHVSSPHPPNSFPPIPSISTPNFPSPYPIISRP